jgi:hypothetical protein
MLHVDFEDDDKQDDSSTRQAAQDSHAVAPGPENSPEGIMLRSESVRVGEV